MRQKGKTTKYSRKVADLSLTSNATNKELFLEKLKKLLEKTKLTKKGQKVNITVSIEEALFNTFKNLREMRAVLQTNEDCKNFLEELLWEGEPVSPYDKTSKVYECGDGWYKCKNSKKEFNVLTGTLFQGTKIDLTIWFEIIFRLNSERKGIASTTIAREYGITQTAAWYMLQKIRNAMEFENFQKLKGEVETDECHEGGRAHFMHLKKKIEAYKKNGKNLNKKYLQGFVERGGNAVIVHIPDKEDGTIVAGILRHVEPGSKLLSDENQSYKKLPPIYWRGSVVHGKYNYVNVDDKTVYTNSIESVWTLLKGCTTRIHIHVSEKFLQNYAHEVVFRYNTRKMKAGDAAIWLMQNIETTKITWKQIKDGEYRRHYRNKKRVA